MLSQGSQNKINKRGMTKPYGTSMLILIFVMLTSIDMPFERVKNNDNNNKITRYT